MSLFKKDSGGKMNHKFLAILATLALSTSAFADDVKHSKCDRTKAWSTLSDSEKKLLLTEDASLADKFPNLVSDAQKTDTAFNLAYVYKIVDRDPETVMAIFSNYEDSPKYLGPEIEAAKILDPLDEKGNPKPAKVTKIHYRFNPGAVVPNSEYTVIDTMAKKGDRHALTWSLIDTSGGMGSPTYIDGFFKAEPAGSDATKTLITYCNYVIPDAPDFLAGTVNSEGLKLIQKTVTRTSGWIIGMSEADTKSNLDRYRGIWKTTKAE